AFAVALLILAAGAVTLVVAAIVVDPAGVIAAMVVAVVPAGAFAILVTTVVAGLIAFLAAIPLVIVVVVVASQGIAAQRKKNCHTKNDCLRSFHGPSPRKRARLRQRLPAHGISGYSESDAAQSVIRCLDKPSTGPIVCSLGRRNKTLRKAYYFS